MNSAIASEEPRLSAAEIELKAAELLRNTGTEDQYPVPLEKIGANLGFDCFGFEPNSDKPELAKVSGMVDYAKKAIWVNLAESLPRQRFTLAHELGHAFLHAAHPQTIVDFRSSIDNPASDKEVQANRFAAALLMPRKEFIRQWVRWKGDTHVLAKYFGASQQAVEVRKSVTIDSVT